MLKIPPCYPSIYSILPSVSSFCPPLPLCLCSFFFLLISQPHSFPLSLSPRVIKGFPSDVFFIKFFASLLWLCFFLLLFCHALSVFCQRSMFDYSLTLSDYDLLSRWVLLSSWHSPPPPPPPPPPAGYRVTLVEEQRQRQRLILLQMGKKTKVQRYM